MPTRSLLERLADLTDPRDPRGRVYPFVSLLTRCLVGILAGNTSVAAIAQFGQRRAPPGQVERRSGVHAPDSITEPRGCAPLAHGFAPPARACRRGNDPRVPRHQGSELAAAWRLP